MAFSRLFDDSSNREAYSIILMDGGLGTTLEDIFHKNISHPLWSASLVDEDETTMVAAHLAFLRAGSNIILTSTYQAAYETFRRAGYAADAEAERLMRKAVRLAAEARTQHARETVHAPMSRIALSLGSYGATLEPAAEFTGRYPPPYGPSSESSAAEEQACEDALVAFHFRRLLLYARDAETWDAIDLVAFETVPLLREARAIRRAVARLEAAGCGMKPWYISFVFPRPRGALLPTLPDGRGLEEDLQGVTPHEIARAVFSPQDETDRMARPDGIGINCTDVAHAFRIADEFGAALGWLTTPLPWLVLCPDGGAEYDAVRRAWTPAPVSMSAAGWAQSVKERLPEQCWCFGGLLLGGCCKTGPDDIRELRTACAPRNKEIET